MALPRSCVNNGGPVSLIRLDRVPQLDVETSLSAAALAALSSWQARPGEVLTVIDPEATAYRARIISLVPEQACCVPFQRLAKPVESSLRIEVYQSLPDKERFELVLQKLTELGVARIVPMESQHSATLEERDAQQKKSHRWPEVVNKASRQCRRAMLPELLSVHSFTEALARAVSVELKLMLYEGDVAWSFTEGIGSFRPQSVALLIGPEGGFSADEVAQAQADGFLPVSLGPRILRTETAAIVAAALAQSYLGDLG
jgi:16S rRNA (uracil1498-N3)-methyltransferase